MTKESLMKFPCTFTIKVFGRDDAEFREEVKRIIKLNYNELADNNITENLSKNGKYLALSITINAKSKKELDEIYQALNASPLVTMTL